jgi:hypothetical protein
VIDRIVVPEDGVVHHTHMACTAREHVVLTQNVEYSSSSLQKDRHTYLVCCEKRRWYQSEGPVSPWL